MYFDLILNSPVFLKEKTALLQGKGSHAYIIEGAKGIGKKAFALAASCVHFCQSADKPCFTCPGCRKSLEGIHPDLHFIYPDGNMLKVDQVREVLSTVYESAYEGASKIYVFEDFHLANEHAQNALLKTLEEPPKNVTFFLLCENSLKLLPTIRSRCKKLRLNEFSEREILSQIQKAFPDNEKNEFVAKESYGNIGRAINLISDERYAFLNLLVTDILSNKGLTHGHIEMILEKEKDDFLTIAELLELKLFQKFRETKDTDYLLKLKAVQESLAAKQKNVNSGLIFDRLAYTLAKGGQTWHR